MSTMTFRLNGNREMELVGEKIKKEMNEVRKISPEPIRRVSKFSNNYAFSIAPVGMVVATAVANTTGAGVFWDAFIKFIYPWLLDIAKVFCAIKIAQGFYNEKRAGKDGGSGLETLVTYGKWLLFFHLVPFFVLLIDQLGLKMVNDLKVNPMNE